jgi:PAS domain S-box-containing protein
MPLSSSKELAHRASGPANGDRRHASPDPAEPFRLFVEAVEDYAIFMLDVDGNIVTWNLGAERIKGYTAAEAIGMHFSRFYTEEDLARHWPAHVLSVARREGRCEDEGWRMRKDGTRFWADVVVTALHDECGRLTGFGKVTRDLTDRRRMEALQESEERLNEFLAMFSHELRNPLAPVTHALELIRNTPTHEHQKLIGVIERQVAHLRRLVDDLLDVSRLTRGKIRLKKEVADLNGLAALAFESSQPMIAARGHAAELRPYAEPLLVDADPTRIVQAAVNLITNAAKYTPRGGRISITVDRVDDGAALRVKDSGVGIAPALLPTVFDVFVQGDRSLDRPEGGLGIGLTVVKRLVEMHGGSVSAFSEGADRGSEFVIYLPLSDSELAPPPDPARIPRYAHKRLLVIDDNADFALTLGGLLEVAGHEVRTVNDGVEALTLAAVYRPDAVLVDIGLPRMNGYDVARELRSVPEFAATTLIALTGYGQDEDRQRAREAGFDDHLVKPVEARELLRIIDQARTSA